MKSPTLERRRFVRSNGAPRFGIDLLHAQTAIPATRVNVSEGGLCLRLRQALEVRSLVRLRLTLGRPAPAPGSWRSGQPVECTGRVAWVTQRLDLRNTSSLFYDVGIEFIDLPPTLRQLLAPADPPSLQAGRRQTILPPASIRGREYLPRLERSMDRVSPWHLVVLVDDTPCFSGRYTTKRLALEAWAQFQRQRARMSSAAS